MRSAVNIITFRSTIGGYMYTNIEKAGIFQMAAFVTMVVGLVLVFTGQESSGIFGWATASLVSFSASYLWKEVRNN